MTAYASASADERRHPRATSRRGRGLATRQPFDRCRARARPAPPPAARSSSRSNGDASVRGPTIGASANQSTPRAATSVSTRPRRSPPRTLARSRARRRHSSSGPQHSSSVIGDDRPDGRPRVAAASAGARLRQDPPARRPRRPAGRRRAEGITKRYGSGGGTAPPMSALTLDRHDRRRHDERVGRRVRTLGAAEHLLDDDRGDARGLRPIGVEDRFDANEPRPKRARRRRRAPRDRRADPSAVRRRGRPTRAAGRRRRRRRP